MGGEGRIPPLRAALLQPIDRDETYSASALYSAALVRELLPEIARRIPHGPRIGIGASLGRYQRITRFVRMVHRGGDDPRPVPVGITCGTAEENLHNNRALAAALE